MLAATWPAFRLKVARMAVGLILLIPFMVVGEQVDLLPLLYKAAHLLRRSLPFLGLLIALGAASCSKRLHTQHRNAKPAGLGWHAHEAQNEASR
ncbi:hypothetical protein LJ737_20910 [Hymenobacter sp. 15J16-1T3B]|uniref:hypothetical protein n=1 Tax=Hymenobacter sp. 15J16-1T3B TaxID=2886941 RepID=UPI001D0FD734|nr:hypothetical protein [Hymenobacter sp. 15J16-1T3B]MCC3159715.1 hypothetical protein [Hymenobacter sp. 15J16-1T3B]